MEDPGCRDFSFSLDVSFGFAPYLNSTVEYDNTDTVFHPFQSKWVHWAMLTHDQTISNRCTKERVWDRQLLCHLTGKTDGLVEGFMNKMYF